MTPKLTTEQFIARAIDNHGDKYDYSETIYTSRMEQVKIWCKEHNNFFYQIAGTHIHGGSGCPTCGKERISSKLKRISLEDFIEKSTEVHKGKYDYSLVVDFQNYKIKVDIVCPIHGTFKQSVQGHLLGKGCKHCGHIERANKRSATQDEFIAKCVAVHGTKYDYSKVVYTKAKNKVLIRCTVHDHWFEQEARGHSLGKGCPECHREVMGQYCKLTTEDFITRSNEVHGNSYDYSLIREFKNSLEKVPILCTKHGVFHQTVTSHLHAETGCPECCNGGGYQPQNSGTFYILRVTEDVIKFGITNNIERRLKEVNRKSSFLLEPLYVFDFEDGNIPKNIESEVKKDCSIGRGLVNKADLPSGYTETTYTSNIHKLLFIVNKYMPS